jgi:hypothetical protein
MDSTSALFAVIIPLTFIFVDLKLAIVEIPELTKFPLKDSAATTPETVRPLVMTPTILPTNCTFV